MPTVPVGGCAVIGVRMPLALVQGRMRGRPLHDGTPVQRGRRDSRQGKQPGEQPVQPNPAWQRHLHGPSSPMHDFPYRAVSGCAVPCASATTGRSYSRISPPRGELDARTAPARAGGCSTSAPDALTGPPRATARNTASLAQARRKPAHRPAALLAALAGGRCARSSIARRRSAIRRARRSSARARRPSASICCSTATSGWSARRPRASRSSRCTSRRGSSSASRRRSGATPIRRRRSAPRSRSRWRGRCGCGRSSPRSTTASRPRPTGRVGARLGEFQARVTELATQAVEQRVAAALLRMVNQSGRRTRRGIEIAFPVTRADIAEMTGTTLHTVSRLLSAWERDGIVKSTRRHITVTAPHRLVVLSGAAAGYARLAAGDAGRPAGGDPAAARAPRGTPPRRADTRHRRRAPCETARSDSRRRPCGAARTPAPPPATTGRARPAAGPDRRCPRSCAAALSGVDRWCRRRARPVFALAQRSRAGRGGSRFGAATTGEGRGMSEILTKAAARNIFYGGSLFFFVVFVALTLHSHCYIVDHVDRRAGADRGASRAASTCGSATPASTATRCSARAPTSRPSSATS